MYTVCGFTVETNSSTVSVLLSFLLLFVHRQSKLSQSLLHLSALSLELTSLISSSFDIAVNIILKF